MSLFAQTGILQIFFLIALALVIAILLLRSHRHFSRRSYEQPTIVRTPRPQPSEQAHHLDSPDELGRWEVQMHDIARDLSAQLDSKMSALQHLVQEADRASARLEAALRAAAADDPELQAEPKARPPVGQPDRLDWQPTDQAEALKSPRRRDPSSVASRPARDEPAENLPAQRRYEEIYTLADYGLEATEISQRVGTPVGEVQLILGLRKQR